MDWPSPGLSKNLSKQDKNKMVNSEHAKAVSLKKDPPGKKDNEGTRR